MGEEQAPGIADVGVEVEWALRGGRLEVRGARAQVDLRSYRGGHCSGAGVRDGGNWQRAGPVYIGATAVASGFGLSFSPGLAGAG